MDVIITFGTWLRWPWPSFGILGVKNMLEPETNNTQVIPDFFYEFISRIIPGLVVITISLYWSDSDIKAIFSSVGLSLFVLVAAWIIGMTLDAGGFTIVKRICPQRFLEKIPSCHPNTHDHLCKTNRWEREIFSKAQAQSIFFRSMTTICALSIFLTSTVTIFSSKLNSMCPALLKHLPALLRHPWIYGICGFVFFFVFLSCWWAQRKCLESWSTNIVKK